MLQMGRILLVSFAFWVTAVLGEPSVRVIHWGARHGEVEPCGCPVKQLGGLARLAFYVEKSASKTGRALLVDGGESFFEVPELPPTRVESAKERAEFIADAYRQLGVAVFVPGGRDFALGLSELKRLIDRSGAAAVSANLFDSSGKPVFATFKIVETSKGKLGFSGLSSGTIKEAAVKDPLESLRLALAQMKAAGADRAVAVVATQEEAETAQKAGFDWVAQTPEAVGGKTISVRHWNVKEPQPESQETIELGPEWEGKSKLTKPYRKFLQRLKSRAIAKVEPASVQRKGAYVAQAGVCKQCHAKQYDFWEGTKHASAYLVLYAKDQHFNPECIGCHSLGFGEDKGFKSIVEPVRWVGQPKRVKGEEPRVEKWMKELFASDSKKPLDSRLEPERYAGLKAKYHAQIRDWQEKKQVEFLHMGVQCEHCHGNRSGHPGPDFAKVGAVKPSACTQCHTPPHDESFSFKERVSKVACPKIR
jgi:hypothetical protein